MPSYKLYYFDVRGAAEPTRLVFAAAGIDYEDIRFNREQWLANKEELNTPFGQLPMLVVDGVKIAQSMAILQYVAREAGFCPSDNLGIAKCDMIVGAHGDLIQKMIKAYYEEDEEKKKKFKEEFDNEHVPKFFGAMQKLLLENGKGFFVGKKLSYADIVVFNVCDNNKDKLDKFTNLKAFHTSIAEIPGIKNWLEKRPKSAM